MKPLLCVDFDGTIYDGERDCLMPGCIGALLKLQDRFRIGIFSARITDREREQMKGLLTALGVPYDEILERKPDAVAYIDDKGIRFTSWEAVCASL